MLTGIIFLIALAALIAYCFHLHTVINLLSYDPTYGCLTRPALDRKWRGRGEVIFLDLDDMKHYNSALGYAEVDSRIRAGLAGAIRQGEAYAGRWYSGDEIVALVPEGLGQIIATRLLHSFRLRGLSATISVAPAQNTLLDTVKIAADKVQAAKAANQKDQVV